MVLSGAGCKVVATDVPAVVPLLTANLAAAGCSAHELGSALAAPLVWGSTDAVSSLLNDGLVRQSLCDTTSTHAPRFDLIVAADVVYHEPLIVPLLETVLALTELTHNDGSPPRVLIAYVHRFKRARSFFRLARRHFDVQVLPAGGVVDYDTLVWSLPLIGENAACCADGARCDADTAAGAICSANGGAMGGVVVTSACADHGRYVRLLAQHGSTMHAGEEGVGARGSEASIVPTPLATASMVRSTPAVPASGRCSDEGPTATTATERRSTSSDSEDEADGRGGQARINPESLLYVPQGSSDGVVAAASATAAAHGFRLADPLRAEIVILTRRTSRK